MSLLIQSSQIVSAQEGGSFSLAPAKIELVLDPGSEARGRVTVINQLGREAVFEAEVQDIVGSLDPTVGFELREGEESEFSLKNFVSISPKQLTIADGQSGIFEFTIQLPKTISPGGRYGGVLVSPVRGEATGGGASLRSRLGSTILLRIRGEANEEGQLKKFETINQKRFYFFEQPEFQILFENSGNVHLNPSGEVRFSNFLGAPVGKIPVSGWSVLPESARTKVLSSPVPLAFGFYSASLALDRGYGGLIDRASLSFFSFSWPSLVLLLALLFLIIFLVLRKKPT